MNNWIDPNPAPEATPPDAAKLVHLYRMVEGLLDADLLLAEEGGTLLKAITAARRARDRGDVAAARRHTTRFVLAMEGLVRDGLLDEAHGRGALEAARRMLNDTAG
jgi:hypothetical protein